MAVLDAANLAQTSQTLAANLKIFDQARQTVSQLTSVSSALGSMGAGSGGLGSPLRTLEASMALPVISFDSWNLPKELQNPNTGSFSSARDFVGLALGVTPNKNQTLAYGDFDSAQRRRALAFRDASWNGYALAIQQRQTIQPSLERAASLADQSSLAATLIDEIRATNYLLAQIAGELTAQRQIMASTLELQSSQAIATSPIVFTGTASTVTGPTSTTSGGPLGQ
jgi:hypothetical protein